MRRKAIAATGVMMGAAGVLVLPAPGKPQQLKIAGIDTGGAASSASASGTSQPNPSSTSSKHTTKQSRHAAASASPASTPAETTSPPPASTSSASTSSTSVSPPTPQTVLGQMVSTQFSQFRVKLQVTGGKVASVGFTTFTAFDGNSLQIDQYAIPILIRETIAAQSAHIQAVTGATYTSDAYVQSLQAAIDQAHLG